MNVRVGEEENSGLEKSALLSTSIWYLTAPATDVHSKFGLVGVDALFFGDFGFGAAGGVASSVKKYDELNLPGLRSAL